MTDLEISTRLAKDRAKGREEKRPNALDRVVEKMTPRMSSRQEQDKQMLMIRLLLVVVLPIVLILASAEYITTKNVNPMLTVVGTGVMTMLATMLRVNGPDDKTKS